MSVMCALYHMASGEEETLITGCTPHVPDMDMDMVAITCQKHSKSEIGRAHV